MTSTIITGLISLAGTALTGYIAYTMARLKQQGDLAAETLKEAAAEAARAATRADVKAEEVKRTLEKTSEGYTVQLAQIAETGEKTHTLVNSNMGVQLRLNAVVTRRLAEITKGTPDGKADEEAATAAERLLREHEGKQAVVDSGKTTS